MSRTSPQWGSGGESQLRQKQANSESLHQIMMAEMIRWTAMRIPTTLLKQTCERPEPVQVRMGTKILMTSNDLHGCSDAIEIDSDAHTEPAAPSLPKKSKPSKSSGKGKAKETLKDGNTEAPKGKKKPALKKRRTVTGDNVDLVRDEVGPSGLLKDVDEAVADEPSVRTSKERSTTRDLAHFFSKTYTQGGVRFRDCKECL